MVTCYLKQLCTIVSSEPEEVNALASRIYLSLVHSLSLREIHVRITMIRELT